MAPCVLQKPILGTTDSECWHCLGVRCFLLEILQAFMTATEAVAVQRVDRVGASAGVPPALSVIADAEIARDANG